MTRRLRRRRLIQRPRKAATRCIRLAAAAPFPFAVSQTTASNGEVSITVEATGRGRHTFSIRADNLDVEGGAREVQLPGRAMWKARVRQAGSPWVAVVIADGNVAHRRDVVP